jgi:hypothetical protein
MKLLAYYNNDDPNIQVVKTNISDHTAAVINHKHYLCNAIAYYDIHTHCGHQSVHRSGIAESTRSNRIDVSPAFTWIRRKIHPQNVVIFNVLRFLRLLKNSWMKSKTKRVVIFKFFLYRNYTVWDDEILYITNTQTYRWFLLTTQNIGRCKACSQHAYRQYTGLVTIFADSRTNFMSKTYKLKNL